MCRFSLKLNRKMISDEMMTGYDIYKDLELIEAGKRKTMSDSSFTIKKALSA